jgi:hypothetical protein
MVTTDVTSTSITLTRPPVEAGTTIHHTVELIKRLDVNDPSWNDTVSKLIKRLMHHEKHSVYSRCYNYRNLDEYSQILADKIQTHETLYATLTDELNNKKG